MTIPPASTHLLTPASQSPPVPLRQLVGVSQPPRASPQRRDHHQTPLSRPALVFCPAHRYHWAPGGSDRKRGSDAGAGTVICVGVLTATLLLAGTCAVGAAAHRAATATGLAADHAALAAASTAANDPGGDPCGDAARIAAAGDATLTACAVGTDAVATVTVRSVFDQLPVPVAITRAARAGPADLAVGP